MCKKEYSNDLAKVVKEFLDKDKWHYSFNENSGVNGCFEFDFRDGEVRFRNFIDCESVVPPIAVIKNSIYWMSTMFKRYALILQILSLLEVLQKRLSKNVKNLQKKNFVLWLVKFLGNL